MWHACFEAWASVDDAWGARVISVPLEQGGSETWYTLDHRVVRDDIRILTVGAEARSPYMIVWHPLAARSPVGAEQADTHHIGVELAACIRADGLKSQHAARLLGNEGPSAKQHTYIGGEPVTDVMR